MFRRSILLLASFTLVPGTLVADVVVPSAYEFTEAPATFSLTSTTSGRTYQFVINANQMTGLVGQSIAGLQWRLNGAATANWPAVDTSYSFFDIFVGPGVQPSAISNTFAANFSGTATQVRSGSLVFSANSFLDTGAGPNPFGAAVMFTTPYVYLGGDLTLEMRFAQQVGATNQPSFDGIGSTDPLYGSAIAARWTGSPTGTTGALGNFLVTNFVTVAVPEPTTIAFVGLSVLSVAAYGTRRRWKRRMRKLVRG